MSKISPSDFSLLKSKIEMLFLRFSERGRIYKSSNVRNYFEKQILPYFHASSHFEKILIVGIANYTQHYTKYFKNKKLIRTIDLDKSQLKFAKKKIHIHDSVENVKKYFDDESLDLVLMNGVYGWGLNDKNGLVNSLIGINNILKKDGWLVFGYNQVKKRDPLLVENSDYFSGFNQMEFRGKHRIFLKNNPQKHVFKFYNKTKTI